MGDYGDLSDSGLYGDFGYLDDVDVYGDLVELGDYDLGRVLFWASKVTWMTSVSNVTWMTKVTLETWMTWVESFDLRDLGDQGILCE